MKTIQTHQDIVATNKCVRKRMPSILLAYIKGTISNQKVVSRVWHMCCIVNNNKKKKKKKHIYIVPLQLFCDSVTIILTFIII